MSIDLDRQPRDLPRFNLPEQQSGSKNSDFESKHLPPRSENNQGRNENSQNQPPVPGDGPRQHYFSNSQNYEGKNDLPNDKPSSFPANGSEKSEFLPPPPPEGRKEAANNENQNGQSSFPQRSGQNDNQWPQYNGDSKGTDTCTPFA